MVPDDLHARLVLEMLHVAGEDREVFEAGGRGEPEVGDANCASGTLERGGNLGVGEQVAADEAKSGGRTEKAVYGSGRNVEIDGTMQELGLHHPEQHRAVTGALGIEIGEAFRVPTAAPEINEDRGVG